MVAWLHVTESYHSDGSLWQRKLYCSSLFLYSARQQSLYSFSAECLPKEAGVVYVHALALALAPSAAYCKLTFDLNTLLD